jgi:hypothetical protein
MFLATVLLYPCVLAVLCAGAGLLADRASGRLLPAPLLLSVGAATLIAVSQLTTYVSPLAPATPYVMLAVAAAGFALGRETVRALALRWRELRWLLAVPLLVYVVALAPVLLAGRTTFSSYMALADSAVHIMGADFLLRHGQDYAHLDLRNSYGQFINNYYNTSYPSGADTLFGGSAFLLGLPLIWAFQPFNAFMLATASGPAWLLARRMRLQGPWAACAALTAVLGALVYAYELFGSVKELTALGMILALGCLAVLHRRWLAAGPAAAIPAGLVVAAGVSALGIAFGAWALIAALVLAIVAAGQLHSGTQTPARVLRLLAGAAITILLAAWPTWIHISGSLHVAQAIASTSNAGNLHTPLRAIQAFGVWLRGSYKLAPVGGALLLTHTLIAAMAIAAVLGALQLLRSRAYAFAGWLAGMLLAWLAVGALVTTWASAKTLMLTSPVLVLLAWGGVAALRCPSPQRSPLRTPLWAVGSLLALAILAGVLVSDALQYHSSNLAPTARYQELASLDSRFAGKGPTLFTDFDEYALYELRDLDVGGPDFVFPPPALVPLPGSYGEPVDLGHMRPAALLAYPLIVTRRDPSASRPPAAYRLRWQGAYYQVWGRFPAAPAPLVHRALSGTVAKQCSQLRALAPTARAGARGARLLAAPSPELVRISLGDSVHPAHWGHQRNGLVMSRAGRLSARFDLPSGGLWDVWVHGQIMPAVALSVDGRPLGSIAGQLGGNSLIPDTVPALPVQLAAGAHQLSLSRGGATLSPGDGGSAVLDAIFLTPARADPRVRPLAVPAARARSLCGGRYDWIELLAG